MTPVRDGRPRRVVVTTVAAAAVSTIGLVAGAGPASAAGTVDQQQTTIDFPVSIPAGAPVAVAQTFTSAIAGQLDQIDVAFERASASTTGNFTVEVQTVAGGQPTGTVVTSGTIPASRIAVSENGADTTMQLYAVPVTPVEISAGQDFAIVISHPTDEWFTSLAFGDHYTPGIFELRDQLGNWLTLSPDSDIAFRTHVSALGLPPEHDGLISGLLAALEQALPPLASITVPLRSLLRELGL
jgi:hypothetical protein